MLFKRGEGKKKEKNRACVVEAALRVKAARNDGFAVWHEGVACDGLLVTDAGAHGHLAPQVPHLCAATKLSEIRTHLD